MVCVFVAFCFVWWSLFGFGVGVFNCCVCLFVLWVGLVGCFLSGFVVCLLRRGLLICWFVCGFCVIWLLVVVCWLVVLRGGCLVFRFVGLMLLLVI